MKKFYLTLFTTVFMLFMLAGCGKKTAVIDPAEYLKLTFKGYEGYGEFESKEFDAVQMCEDFKEQLGNVSKSKLTKLFGDGANVKVNNDAKYSNGDKIRIEWNVDEDKLAEFEKEYKVSITLKDFEYSVSGLAAVETFDPFETLTVNSSGISGRAELTLTNSAYPSLRFFFIDQDGDRVSEYTKASNNDKIKIIIYSNGNDITKLCLDTLGKAPTRTEMEYTVTGLDAYVTDLSEITSALEEKKKLKLLPNSMSRLQAGISPVASVRLHIWAVLLSTM